MNKKLVNFLLLLSLVEGASVMAAELLGAKMLSPFFGSSLYVWSSVMAITLGGLATGYFFGGRISLRKNSETILYRVVLIASLLTILMPYTAELAMSLFGMRSLIPAVIVCSLLILFPPVFLMGAVSPLIIGTITMHEKDAGKAAGTVYAISTVGGILSTFLFGFWIIPTFGLTIPAIITGLALAILPVYALVKKKAFKSLIPFWIAIVISVIQLIGEANSAEKGNSINKLIYKNDGVLGQIMVIDHDDGYYYEDSTRTGEYSRWIYVNGISQTKYHPNCRTELDEEVYFSYVHKIGQFLEEALPEGSRSVLLVGLGGGVIAKHLTENGFDVEVCELDERMEYVAREYFELPDNVDVTIDDGRHFINTVNKKYDVILFDIFKGEETPSHILTKESLERVKEILNPSGIFLINSYNFLEGDKGQGLRSIYVTLDNAGFNASIWPTAVEVDDRNLLFISSFSEYPMYPEFIDLNTIDFSDAMVLTDDRPNFEVLNARASLKWRRWAIYAPRVFDVE
ncbi:MAG: fused MFS/spermidine synthase [Crocinitomicaceae bacterium]|nr:fused MFS/spermidine synthase [Crocinitomicaceae bacterium]